jgi:tRNA A-37 threonylcarbamoyl transferase component Bud32
MFETILSAYKAQMKDKKKDCDEIMAKFEDVRQRGRKRTMVG